MVINFIARKLNVINELDDILFCLYEHSNITDILCSNGAYNDRVFFFSFGSTRANFRCGFVIQINICCVVFFLTAIEYLF